MSSSGSERSTNSKPKWQQIHADSYRHPCRRSVGIRIYHWRRHSTQPIRRILLPSAKRRSLLAFNAAGGSRATRIGISQSAHVHRAAKIRRQRDRQRAYRTRWTLAERALCLLGETASRRCFACCPNCPDTNAAKTSPLAKNLDRLIRAFDPLFVDNARLSEDFSFCHRWRKCGGQIWANAVHELPTWDCINSRRATAM